MALAGQRPFKFAFKNVSGLFFHGKHLSFSAPGMCAPQEGARGSRVMPESLNRTVVGPDRWRKETPELMEAVHTSDKAELRQELRHHGQRAETL